jgi:hypothetical protein
MSGSTEAFAGAGDDAGVAADGYGAPTVKPMRGFTVRDAAMAFLFTTLLIDGFPLGADLLREFGARPTNFLLAIAWMAMIARRVMKGRAVGLERHESYLLVAVFVGAPLLNLPVAFMQSTIGTGLTLLDWAKQFPMLAWGLMSYFIWKRIIAGMGQRHYCALLCVSAVVPFLAYFVQWVTTSGPLIDFLNLFRIGANDRLASLATEPALYGAWIAFIWPLMLYYSLTGQRALGRLGARIFLLLAIGSAVLSNARTFVVILLLQLVYVCYWATQRRHGWGTRVRSLLLALCVTVAAAVVLAGRLFTIIDLANSRSDVTRFGDTITGINVAVAHPWVGVGIGEFGNFFAQYAPEFALSSVEVAKNVVGDSKYRASTFNMFVRLCVEFGIPLGIALSIFILRPIFAAPKANPGERFVLYAALSAVGGAGFWLSQDPYGYQPAILAMAVLTMSMARVKRNSADSAIGTAAEV